MLRSGALHTLKPQAAVETALKQSAAAKSGTPQNPAPVPTDSETDSESESESEEEGKANGHAQANGNSNGNLRLAQLVANRFLEPRTRTASRKVEQLVGEAPQLLQLPW